MTETMQEQTAESRARDVEEAVRRVIAAHDEVESLEGAARSWAEANPAPRESRTYASAQDMAEHCEERETWQRAYNALRRDVHAAEERSREADKDCARIVGGIIRRPEQVSIGYTDADGTALVVTVHPHIEQVDIALALAPQA